MIWNTAKEQLYKKWRGWWMERHPVDIGEYSWTFLFERGKQIRAHLFCELWDYLCPEQPPCIEIAFMIECVHVTSLILDDLPWMDHAKERRGWETLHSKFSIRKALLLAHDVLELAYEVGQSNPLLQKERKQMEVWYDWCHEKMKVLWYGQWLDLSQTGNLEELAQMKTGILFECVSESVALFLGLDPLFWREWGKTLGILFQWMDDWNDREEDRNIQQRNAFNESYHVTMSTYTEHWIKVVQGIGKEWWNRPFGQYLWKYFTALYPDPPFIPRLSSLSSLSSFFHPSLSSCPSSLSTRMDVTSHTGLSFMTLLLPFLNTPTITIETRQDWSLSELWEKEETEWIEWLTTKEEIKPFLLPLRQIERMIQTVNKSTGS